MPEKNEECHEIPEHAYVAQCIIVNLDRTIQCFARDVGKCWRVRGKGHECDDMYGKII